MEPIIEIKNNKIYITGHYDNIIKCAKLDFLCKLYKAKKSRGFAELDYNEKFLSDFNQIDMCADFACEGSCTAPCTWSCWAYCQSDCFLTCADCTGGCMGACKESCRESCTGSCTGSCEGKCTGNCKGCGGKCSSNCVSCSSVASCSTACDDGCSDSAVAGIYNAVVQARTNLSTNPLIKAQDITNLELLIRNEMARRSKEARSHESEEAGQLINAAAMNLMINDLADMEKIFSRESVGYAASIEKIKAYMIAAEELYLQVLKYGE